MSYYLNLLLTAFGPIVWGSTYLVTTEYLPDGYPITIAMLRALPAGLLLLLCLRQLPQRSQWLKVFILGGLNFTVFWSCLFIAAYRLPGGVAATLGAVQPLAVIGLGYGLFDYSINRLTVVSAIGGMVGVAFLVLKANGQLDAIGMLAALLGALSMAAGTLLSEEWRGDTPLLTFTGWQLTSGGLLLLPLSLFLEPQLPPLHKENIVSLIWLSLIGALIAYSLWFRGIKAVGSIQVSVLGFLSPLTAILLGWLMLGQSLTPLQIIGVLIIFASIITINRRKSP